MYKKAAAVFIMLALTLTACGCWNLMEVKDTAIATGVGVDLLEDGRLHFVSQYEIGILTGDSGEPVKPKNIVIAANGSTVTQAARNTILFLARVPLWAHASCILIGENLAQSDLVLIADFFIRNRNFREDCPMFVAHNASIEELFGAINPLTGESARDLEELMRNQELLLGNNVSVGMDEFLAKLANPGIDPVLPMLTVAKMGNSPVIKLQGMAVFKERRMVGSLNQTESRGYRWLNPAKNMGGELIALTSDGKTIVNFAVVNFKAKQKPRWQNGEIIMDIEVQAALNFYEQLGTEQLVGKVEQKQKLEKAAAQQIKQEIQACIKKAQNLNSDILGWGQSVYRYYPAVWDTIQSDWEELYPQVRSNIKVECLVDRTYITTRSFQFR